MIVREGQGRVEAIKIKAHWLKEVRLGAEEVYAAWVMRAGNPGWITREKF